MISIVGLFLQFKKKQFPTILSQIFLNTFSYNIIRNNRCCDSLSCSWENRWLLNSNEKGGVVILRNELSFLGRWLDLVSSATAFQLASTTFTSSHPSDTTFLHSFSSLNLCSSRHISVSFLLAFYFTFWAPYVSRIPKFTYSRAFVLCPDF